MLSVVICTYNRERYIYNVLESVALNDFPFDQYEIILINNNCTDNTESECNRFHKLFPQVDFRYFVETNQGLSYARNRGIKESTGEILIYVDDDAVVNDSYLKSYYDFFIKTPDAYAAGGAIIPKYEICQPLWMSYYVQVLLTAYLYKGKIIKEFKYGQFPGGGNAAYRKEVFRKLGLFNVNLGRKGDSLAGAEEKDIFDKMRMNKMPYYYVPDSILYHIIPKEKLSNEYFKRLTISIGQSEKTRTLQLSKLKYCKRLFLEGIKWGATILLVIGYVLLLSTQKAWKLLQFRWNVSRGLIG